MIVNLEEEFIKNFEKSKNKNNISIEYPEFNNTKWKSNYDYIIQEIINSNPIEDNTNYQNLEYNEIIYYALNIVKSLLGDSVSNKELYDIATIIVVTDNKGVMDGYYTNIRIIDKTTNNEKENHDILFIPGMNKTASIVCLVHEIMHYLERVERIKSFNNYRYMETMSQVGESFASYQLERNKLEKNIMDKIYQLRLDAIKFQQESLIIFQNQFKNFIVIPEVAQAYNYEISRDHAYLMGFVHQVCLFNRFLADEQTFLTNIRKIFKNESTVEELLEYYGIDLKHNKIVDEAVRVIKKYK